VPAISCPTCHEDERLAGQRLDDGSVQITCEACETVWVRGERRCGLCGSDDLEYTPKALWEKGRGDQHTPAGRIDAYRCYACGGFDVTSSNPRPGPPDYVPSRRIDQDG
jgi:hypothetical protein